MTPGFAARRRAEEFNSLVEDDSTAVLTRVRNADLLELVSILRETPPVEPRADFVADLRRQLMTEAATVLTPTAARLTVTPRRSPRERRIAIAIGGFAVVSATTSMAMAAQTALPGDTLYPLKRALENASTTIQIDEDAKGTSLLEQASGRLDELDELTRERDDASAQVVADTLHTFADQATTASDLMIAAYADKGEQSDIEELRSFTARSMAALNQLETVVPDKARAALIEAAQVINLIDSAAIQLCPTCGEGGAQVPAFEQASVDGLLGNLGASALGALDGPDAVKSPDKDGDGRGGDGRLGAEQGGDEPKGGGKPDKPVDFPEPVPDDPINGGAAGNPDGGNGGGGRDNVIRDLTDRLTGGEKGPDTNPGTLDDVLDDALGGLVNNLLGK